MPNDIADAELRAVRGRGGAAGAPVARARAQRRARGDVGVAAWLAAGGCGREALAAARRLTRRLCRQHLDGNAFLVSVGNVRRVEREQREPNCQSEEEEEEGEEEDEDASVVALAPSAADCATSGEPVLLELHVVFHAMYRTPALYFRAAGVDGTPVAPERVLRGVRLAGRGARALVVASVEQHPVLGSPFALLHPCETAAAMELLLAQSGPSREGDATDGAAPTYLASWLSLVQPLTGISPLDYY